MNIRTTLLSALTLLATLAASAWLWADEEAEDDKIVIAATIDEFVVTEEMVDFLIANSREESGGSQALGREQSIDHIITLYLLAREYDRQDLGKDDFAVWRGIARAKSNAVISQRVSIDKGAIKKLYDEKYTEEAIKSFKEMEYHTRHILVESEDQARALISQIKEGADFAKLAKENSSDKGSAIQGGDLGWYSPNSLVAPYSEAMQSLEVGEMTDDPVKSRFGWHIIELVEEPRKGKLPTFAEKERELQQELFQTQFANYLEGLKEKAKIDIREVKGN